MTFVSVCSALVLAASVAASPALADQPAAKTALPGVKQPEPIVKPLAEPLEQAGKNGDGFVRMGDWDVKISGQMRVDIRAGTLPGTPR
ncbi:hypothetical protein ACSBOB_22295 [Mesorhizobium sp. ASY16-5R]|uniref:hypothetical protein n=1 Tax=Mesorhizobium sp. ASY16-5R TaxID=3445772 RepID=UPI003F9F4926